MFKPEALTYYRKLRGLTQAALALKIARDYEDPVDAQQISDYERSQHVPGSSRLRNLARALEISTDQLFELPPVIS